MSFKYNLTPQERLFRGSNLERAGSLHIDKSCCISYAGWYLGSFASPATISTKHSQHSCRRRTAATKVNSMEDIIVEACPMIHFPS